MKGEFFETIKVVDGVHHNLSYHQERYENVLKSFAREPFLKLETLLNPPKKGIYKCRILYDLDALRSIEYVAYKKREIKCLKLLYDDTVKYRYKRTNRQHLDALYAQRAGCDDILIIKNTFVSDTSIANVAFLREGVWYSPKDVLLEGTSRARYLKEKKIVLKDIRVDELKSFEKIALLNAMVDFDIIPIKKGDFFVK